jgi:hypothetical protein
MTLLSDLVRLILIAMPVAALTWAFTHEELVRGPREYCIRRSHDDPRAWCRKLFYVFTCEYCFSHYVTIGVLFVTRFKLLFDDWRGYFVAGFSVVWIANHLISLYGRLRLGMTYRTTIIVNGYT